MPKQVLASNIAIFSSNPFLLLYCRNSSLSPLQFDWEIIKSYSKVHLESLCAANCGAANWHCTGGQWLVHELSETMAALARHPCVLNLFANENDQQIDYAIDKMSL